MDRKNGKEMIELLVIIFTYYGSLCHTKLHNTTLDFMLNYTSHFTLSTVHYTAPPVGASPPAVTVTLLHRHISI